MGAGGLHLHGVAVRDLAATPCVERLDAYRLAVAQWETAQQGERAWTAANLQGMEAILYSPRMPAIDLTRWELTLHNALQRTCTPDAEELGDEGFRRVGDVIGRAFTEHICVD